MNDYAGLRARSLGVSDRKFAGEKCVIQHTDFGLNFAVPPSRAAGFDFPPAIGYTGFPAVLPA